MFARPIIERFGKDIPLSSDRQKCADVICEYMNSNDNVLRNEYYESLTNLLNSEDSQRILLYIPFNDLVDAPNNFKKAYIRAWYRLLDYYDARENFHFGDVFEIEARPNGELDRVIKCVHLVPWMLKAGFIDYRQIEDILIKYNSDKILAASFRDILEYLVDNGQLTKSQFERLKELTQGASIERLKPLYITEARVKWYNEQKESDNKLLNPKVDLAGPFSVNLAGQIKGIEEGLGPDDIVLVGGSRLKGYGTLTSDIDTIDFRKEQGDKIFKAGSLSATHIYFNYLWIGGSNVDNLTELSKNVSKLYYNRKDKWVLLERLETDLIQYRLLHKGFSRVTGKKEFITSQYKDMDGDCPFYDDEYRKIATKIFAKYVYMPELSQ